MSSDIAIEVVDISKSYAAHKSSLLHVFSLLFGTSKYISDPFYALKDISFSVKKGETLGIIGSNGAGKSTLLQVICGTLYPTSGNVTVNGKFAALLELGAGFNPEFTGRQNVYLSAAVYGLTQAQIDERLDKILGFAEIGEFIDRPVKTYSSGMFVRLAFAIIVHVDADILIIDEALAVGDVYFTQKCMRFLKAFAEKGTLLFVSHDTTSVVNLCDRAVWLKHGQLQKIGNAQDVSEAYLSSVYENKLPETVAIKAADESASTFESAQFGVGGGRVLSCLLLDIDEEKIHMLDKAQDVIVQVDAQALQKINKPIIGFFIKNRLGQHLFGTNTIKIAPEWQKMDEGESCQVRFRFHMPLLATGDYSVGVALAEGTQVEHVQHHWVHDALAFKAKADPYLTGYFEMDISAEVRIEQ